MAVVILANSVRGTASRGDLRGGSGIGDEIARHRALRRFLVVGGFAAAGLVAVNLVYFVGRYGLEREDLQVPLLFNLDKELNLPTFLSTLLLAVAAWAAMRVGLLRRRSLRTDSALWLGLAAVLASLAFDELVQIHERFILPVRGLFDSSGIFYFAWVIPAIAVLIGLLPVGLKFIRRLDRGVRFLFVLAAVIYVGGALGMELVGGYLCTTRGCTDPAYVAGTIAEESAEMAGMLVLVHALSIQLRNEVDLLVPGAGAMGESVKHLDGG